MRNKSLNLARRTFKYQHLIFTGLISFVLGSLITVNFVPINRTCKLDNTDREYNVMKNSKLKNDELVILILSAPANLAKRNAIRSTWLNFKSNLDESFTFINYFVIGRYGLTAQKYEQITYEQSLHNDILLLPMYDSYQNLTEKLLKSFVWLSEQRDVGFDFKYVLKCDDDSFVKIKDLLHEVLQLERYYLNKNSKVQDLANDQLSYIRYNIQTSKYKEKELQLYWGYFNGKAKIKKSGKWKEDNWINCDYYSPYALGGGYVISKELVLYLASNADHLRRYNSEDISVGLWLAPVNNIIRIHDIRFDTEWESRGCQNSHLIMHHISEKEMQRLYDNIVKTGSLCVVEDLIRVPYLYNWSAPPSKCCTDFIKRNNVLKDIKPFFPIRI